MTREILLAYFFQKYGLLTVADFLSLIQLVRQQESLLPLIEPQHAFSLRLKEFLLSAEKNAIEKMILRDLERGLHFTYPGHDFYPSNFLKIENAPLLLCFSGYPIWLGLPSLSIVGSRQASQLSLQWMEEVLPECLAKCNIAIVSGGARGVDQKAHAIALRSQRPTVAFLPSGLGEIYPPEFRYWVEDVLAGGGALVTEYISNVGMRKHHFQERNRLIAAASVAVLVIEARKKSGTMVTAKRAIEQGKPVWVMPTHPMDSRGIGGLELISEGAQPIISAIDLIVGIGSEISPELHMAPISETRH